MTTETTRPEISALVTFGVQAAREAVDLAAFYGEEVDEEPCMGLWQSFQDEFGRGHSDLWWSVVVPAYRAAVAA